MKNLGTHFLDIATMQPSVADQRRMYAALLAGAEATLNRIKAISGGYASMADVEKVAAELSTEAPPVEDDRNDEQIVRDAHTMEPAPVDLAI